MSQTDASKERKEIVPQMKDRQGWYKFCLGENSSSSASSDTNEKDSSEATLKRKRQLAELLGIAMDKSTVEMEDGEELEEDGEGEDEDASSEADNEEYPDLNRGLAHYLPGSALPEWTGSCGVTPSTSVLLQFDQVLTQKVFVYLVDWLEES